MQAMILKRIKKFHFVIEEFVVLSDCYIVNLQRHLSIDLHVYCIRDMEGSIC